MDEERRGEDVVVNIHWLKVVYEGKKYRPQNRKTKIMIYGTYKICDLPETILLSTTVFRSKKRKSGPKIDNTDRFGYFELR